MNRICTLLAYPEGHVHYHKLVLAYQCNTVEGWTQILWFDFCYLGFDFICFTVDLCMSKKAKNDSDINNSGPNPAKLLNNLAATQHC